MSTNTDNLSVQNILGLIQKLRPNDQYMANKCSLGRAVELADITRWELQDILKERGTSVR